jgi:arabinosyltransferase
MREGQQSMQSHSAQPWIPLLKKKLVRRSLSVTFLGICLFLYCSMLQRTAEYKWMGEMRFHTSKFSNMPGVINLRKRNHLPVAGTPKNRDEDYDDGSGVNDDSDDAHHRSREKEMRTNERGGDMDFSNEDTEDLPHRGRESEDDEREEHPPPPNVSPPPVTEEMEESVMKSSRDFVVRVDKMSFPDAADELLAVVNRMGLRKGAVIMISFANSHHIELAVNFIVWAKKIGATTLIGALDDNAYEILKKTVGDDDHDGHGTAFTYRVDHHLEAQGSSHASAAWKDFAKMRISHTTSLLEFGFDVLMSDADVVWLKNPEAYLKCEKNGGEKDEIEDDVAGCEELKAADVIVSSDNLSPTSDERDGGNYAKGGVFNTGIVFLRHTKSGIRWAKQWNVHLSATDGRFHRLTSDQQVFNAMSRKENAWPGLEQMKMESKKTFGPNENKRVLVAAENDTLLGVFPVAKFNPGHVYMVQRFHEKKNNNNKKKSNNNNNNNNNNVEDRNIENEQEKDEKKVLDMPFAVHATYTFDGSTGDAKKWRFMEAGLWRVPETSPSSSAKNNNEEEKFVTFDASAHLWDDDAIDDHGGITSHDTPSITDHLVAGSGHIKALSNAIAIAASLKRTLLIPPMPCWCDKVWGGHDNIFTFQCHYPGSRDSNHIPGFCPLDHFISPSTLVKQAKALGVKIIPLGAAPATIKSMKNDFPILTVGAEEQLRKSEFNIPTHATEAEIAKLSNVLPSIVKLETTRDAFGGFVDDSKTREFEKKVMKDGLKPEQWCSECHPQGCKNLIPSGTIAKGFLRPVRQVHDQFCATFDEAGRFHDVLSHDNK